MNMNERGYVCIEVDNAAELNDIDVLPGDVPSFLKDGDLFRSFSQDGEEDSITVSKKYLKQTATATNYDELDQLLSTLRFWMVDSLPADLIRAILYQDIQGSEDLVHEFKTQLVPLVTVLKVKLSRGCDKIGIAMKEGAVEIVKVLCEDGLKMKPTSCRMAAANGHLECLRYAHEQGSPWHTETCSGAAQGGNLQCLKYAHENNCPWDVVTTNNAASKCHLDCLKYAKEHGCPCDVQTCRVAAREGALACLQYLHESGVEWDSLVCEYAAKSGHLRCLIYAHEHRCPWTNTTCEAAARYGHLECLQYAFQQGCPLGTAACETVVHNNVHCLRYIFVVSPHSIGHASAREAARHGQLECLKFLHENGCAWQSDTTLMAARYGHLQCLKYAHENGCAWHPELRTEAAHNGHLDCLDYAVKHLCPTTKYMT